MKNKNTRVILVKSNGWEGLYVNRKLVDQYKKIPHEEIINHLQDGEDYTVDIANQAWIDHFSYYPDDISNVWWSDEKW